MRRPALLCLLARPTYDQSVPSIHQDTRYGFFSAQTPVSLRGEPIMGLRGGFIDDSADVNTSIVKFDPLTVETLTPIMGSHSLWNRAYHMHFGAA